MSKRIHSTLKTKLGDLLGDFYSKFGTVLPRKPYHEDDEVSGDGSAKPVFIEHPFLQNLPVGASSDLSSVVNNNQEVLDEAQKRSDELTNEPKHRLEMRLGLTNRKKYIYENYTKPV